MLCKMEVSIMLLSIFCIFSVIPKTNQLVVTSFNQDIIADFFLLLKAYTHAETTNFSGWDLAEYCHKLRQSRIFRVSEAENISNQRISSTYRLEREMLERERATAVEQTEFRVGRYKVIPSQFFNAFKCFNPDRQMNWFVAGDFIRDSAFLFAAVPGMDFVHSREQTGRSRSTRINNIRPNLLAFIDEPAVFTNSSLDDLENYVRSAQISQYRLNGRDLLCGLKSVMKYRLCSIVADLIERIEVSLVPNPPTRQIYQERSNNLYNELNDPEESCPSISVSLMLDVLGVTEVTHNFLYCSVTMEGIGYQFYLSANLLQTSQVFLLRESINEHQPPSIPKVEVPLLRHLRDYSEALQYASDF